MSHSQRKKKPPSHLTYKQLDYVLFYCKEDKAIAEKYVEKWNNWGHDGCLYDDQFYLDWRYDQEFDLIADLCHRTSYQIILVTKHLLINTDVAFLKNQVFSDSIILKTNSVLPILFHLERKDLCKENTFFGLSSLTPLYVQQINNENKFGKLFTYPDVIERKKEREEKQTIKLEEWDEIEKIRIKKKENRKTMLHTEHSNNDSDLSEDGSYEIERKGGEKTTPSTGRSNNDADLSEDGSDEIERQEAVITPPQRESEYDFAANFANHNEEDDGFKSIGTLPNITPQDVRPKEKHIAGVGNLQAAGDSRQGRADLVAKELHQVENLQAAGDVAHVVAKELHQVKCYQTNLSRQITEEGQQLSMQMHKDKQELSQQLGEAIRTEMQKLSLQVDSQLRVISDQMFLQGKELSRNIAMDAGDASQVNLTYSHPVLQKNKALLERHLNVPTELLHRLVTLTIISGDQHKKISAQTGEGGKQKLLLYCVDHSVMEENRLIHCFIEALRDIGGGTNAVLATTLANSCTEDTS